MVGRFGRSGRFVDGEDVHPIGRIVHFDATRFTDRTGKTGQDPTQAML
jgi:hypothetical protein